MVGDALHDHVQRHQIVPALQHDNVGVLPGGLHELLVHGLDGGQVLGHHRLQRAATLLHVPQGTAQDTHVGVRFHENFDIQQITQGLVLEDQNALHDHHLGGAHFHRFIGAVVDGVVVHGTVDGLAPLQGLQMLDHQIGVKGVRVVVVLAAAFFKGAVLPLVVVVMMYHADVAAEPLSQMLGQGGFAGAGAAGHADKNGIHGERLPCSIPLYYRKSSPEKQEKM